LARNRECLGRRFTGLRWRPRLAQLGPDGRKHTRRWSSGACCLAAAGPAGAQNAYLLTWQASFAGDDDRAEVNIGAFQPCLFYQLGEGFYLRSSPVWTYDFESDSYAVPIGLGVGKVIARGDTVIIAFVEPQYSVATRGDFQPEWGAFAGVNFQF
jgi:hypothetical protein